MSNAETRMPLHEARALAERLVSELKDACEQIVIAGSIRRQRADVGDLEIVCVPLTGIVTGGLFGDESWPVDHLEERIHDMFEDGIIAHRLDKNLRKAAGSRYRRLLYRGVPLDLFSPSAESFGAILAIRTGPSEYSRHFVTPRSQGGLMPDHLRMQEGSLRYRVSGQAIPTPTEESFFAAIGVPMLAPEARSTSTAAQPLLPGAAGGSGS